MKTKLDERAEFLREPISDDFKFRLSEFLVNTFNACDGFKSDILGCKTNLDLQRVIHSYGEDIAEKLGFDTDDDEIDSLEKCIRGLESEISDLEDEVVDTKTLWDKERLDLFKKFKDKYTPWELEKLLENG
jgi:hypothetical protein